jgi:hypothetical protein
MILKNQLPLCSRRRAPTRIRNRSPRLHQWDNQTDEASRPATPSRPLAVYAERWRRVCCNPPRCWLCCYGTGRSPPCKSLSSGSSRARHRDRHFASLHQEITCRGGKPFGLSGPLEKRRPQLPIDGLHMLSAPPGRPRIARHLSAGRGSRHCGFRPAEGLRAGRGLERDLKSHKNHLVLALAALASRSTGVIS